MPPVPGRLGHIVDHLVLTILQVGGILGHVAVPKYVLAGVVQFLGFVTPPGVPGDGIDHDPEYERGPRRLVVWTILTLLTIYLMIHEDVDLDDDPVACSRLDNNDLTMATVHRSLIDDLDTLVELEADRGVPFVLLTWPSSA